MRHNFPRELPIVFPDPYGIGQQRARRAYAHEIWLESYNQHSKHLTSFEKFLVEEVIQYLRESSIDPENMPDLPEIEAAVEQMLIGKSLTEVLTVRVHPAYPILMIMH